MATVISFGSFDALDDNSGFYTNIVDNVNNQVHQVGYSSRKRLPWHVIFQLNDGIDPIHGNYLVPAPRIVGGKVMYETSHSPFMKQIHQKEYALNDDMARLVTKDALGLLNKSTRRYIHGARLEAPDVLRPEPANVRQFGMNPPDWMKEYERYLMTRRREHLAFPSSLPPVAEDSIPQARSRRLRVVRPGELGWRPIELVDDHDPNDLSLPQWVRQEAGYVERVHEPRAEELGWDTRGLPKPLRVARPLYDDSGVKQRQYPRLPLPQNMPIPLSYVRYQPEQQVAFVGNARVHTNYSFI